MFVLFLFGTFGFTKKMSNTLFELNRTLVNIRNK